MTVARRHLLTQPAVQITVLLLLFITISALFNPNINTAEAQALWVVDDTEPMWDVSPRDALRGIRANVTDMVNRVPETGLPPVYFGVLDAWTMAFGESLFVVRLLSTLTTVLGIAFILRAIYQFDRTIKQTGAFIIAGLLALIPALTIHVYGVLLLCASVAAWQLVRWCNRPKITGLNTALYLMSLVVTLLIAHVTIPVLLLHGVVAWRAQRLRAWSMVFALALFLITPVMLFFAPSDTAILTSSDSLQIALLAGLTVALPFIVMILGYNLRFVSPVLIYSVVIIFTVISAIIILTKPDWRGAIAEVNSLRMPDAPAISAIDPQSIPAYYDRTNIGIANGITVDVGWRVFTPDEIDIILDNLATAPAIWLFLPENNPNTAYIPEQLMRSRTVTYSHRVGGMHLQRFDLNE